MNSIILKIAVGSKNPAKVEAVMEAFQNQSADIVTLNVASGVSDQPFSDEETIEGAINRANNCLIESDADIGVGLEGGVVQMKHGLFVCNWGAMVTKNSEVFIAGGARIPLPVIIAERLLNGEELGPVMDDYTSRANIRQKEGAIGVFTNERLSRAEMFQQIMRMLIGQYEYKNRRN